MSDTACPILPADDPDAVTRAVEALRAGRLVGVPTETVYGLAGDATDAASVGSIFAAKGRPAVNPLIVHVEELARAERLGRFDGAARALADAFWPGPLTVVVPQREGHGLANAVTAGLGTVALRQPRGVMARLVTRLGRPLAAPSANRSGRLTAVTADRVAHDLGERLALVLDAGPCAIGLESSVVAVSSDGVRLLREGGVPREAIEAVVGSLGIDTRPDGTAAPASPGQLLRHYAPSLPLRLDATDVREGEAALRFAARPGGRAVASCDLSPSGDLDEAAHNLFAHLAALEASGARAIAVAPVPSHGIGAAINDRLARAAAASRADAGDDG